MSMPRTKAETDPELCDGCGHKLGNIDAHHVWRGTSKRYHPACCERAWRDYD